MRKIYENIANHLREQVIELAWIDLDNGQLDYAEYRAAVDFPAALISIDYPQCDNIGLSGAQQCRVNITIRLIDQVFDDTNLAAPDDVRARGIAIFDLADKIQQALQWWKPDDGSFGMVSRQSCMREKRDDGLAVLQIIYSTTLTDNIHYEKQMTYLTIQPVFQQNEL